MRVGELADILKCSFQRERIKKNEQMSNLYEITVEEMRQGSFGGVVNFVPKTPKIRLNSNINIQALNSKIEYGDILISAIGGWKTIGELGFMPFQAEKLILPSKNLFLLRPRSNICDPVWLYYTLLRTNATNLLKEKALESSRSWYLLNDMVENLEIAPPKPGEVNAIHTVHNLFLENVYAAEKRREEEKKIWEKYISDY